MNTYIVVSSKPWNRHLSSRLQQRVGGKWLQIKRKEEFVYKQLKKIEPKYILIPHWSYIIPEKIFENFECIVFHMTDLPYGRGGSPLQNLIKEGHEQTQISAIQVEKDLDAGDIYLKRPLSLLGTAEEIFIRADKVIEEMIVNIIEEDPEPKRQQGQVVTFSRRKPEDSRIKGITGLEELFDHIRMLDAEGYPNAFLETESFRLEFKRASLKTDKLLADVRIFQK
ncbi:methionyl-tRNA formyltransferase [Fodinibius roseus]|uniref:Methionyl-tRNA formyltransferase n=1 Tax=Fodinibius roseus TaxID=1194090 RepID=A0A1M5J2E8_9BACT|nr:formyltransferase family protein [Fodinibius roseus]SHG34390.1 methionyl-tRNA formyltransferase [Fodinibius roseus]